MLLSSDYAENYAGIMGTCLAVQYMYKNTKHMYLDHWSQLQLIQPDQQLQLWYTTQALTFTTVLLRNTMSFRSEPGNRAQPDQ